MNLIECNKNKSFGQPSLIGRRLTVYDIVTKIYYESYIEIALDDYDITLEEAKAATNYCKTLLCQEDQNRIHFCDGCILRTLEEGWNFNKDDYKEIKCNKSNETITISKDGNEIFLGNIQELEDSEFGKVGWLLAAEIIEKYPNLKL
jgi:uncharacterized protein (DUF433 family)